VHQVVAAGNGQVGPFVWCPGNSHLSAQPEGPGGLASPCLGVTWEAIGCFQYRALWSVCSIVGSVVLVAA
jgi:hypothetical protein